MRNEQTIVNRRVRLSAGLVALGLLIQLITLRWSHPTAFLAFLLVGGPLVLAGVLLFLYFLLSPPARPRP